MKIGTLTFYDGRTNYGQALQCFALIAFLRSLGHNSFLIRYDNSIPLKRGLLRTVLSSLYHCFFHPFKEYKKHKCKKKRELMISMDKMHPRGFDVFLEKNIPSSKEIFDKNTPYRNFPHAEAYVCGSDQIWGGTDPVFFLQFAPPDSKRIAYAPSFGGYIPFGKQESLVKKYLRSFDFVSCREQAGVELCKKLGRKDTLLAPDPTLLLDVQYYRELYKKDVPNALTNRKYLFLYLLGNKIDLDITSIFEFSKKHHLEVVYVASQGRFDNYPKMYPTIEEWLNLIDNASYVITNSFHGTVFCLQFRKQFLTIPLVGDYAKQNDRITDLLNRYNLTDRIFKSNIDMVLNDVNYETFDRLHREDIQYITKTLQIELRKK